MLLLLRALVVLAVFATATPASAVLAVDATGTYQQTAGVVAGSTTYTGITMGSVSNGAMTCFVYFAPVAGHPSGVTATWNGTNAPNVGAQNANSGQFDAYVFALINPAAGNNNFVVSFTNPGTMQVGIECISFSGADQTGGVTTFYGVQTTQGTSTAPTATVTSAVGDIVVAMECTAKNVNSTDGTTIFTDNSGLGGNGANRAAGAASVAIGATLASSGVWAEIAHAIKAAAAGGEVRHNMLMLGVGGAP